MILHRYFARRFLTWFAIVAGALGAISALTQVLELMPILPDQPLPVLLELGLLRTPKMIYSVAPLIIVLASAATFLSLGRSSEMTVVRAGAVSLPKAMNGPAIATLLMGIIAVTMFNPLVASTLSAHDTRMAQLSGAVNNARSLGDNGLWLRQGDAQGQTVIQSQDASPDGTRLRFVTMFTYGPDGTLTQRIDAQTATLTDGGWDLRNGKLWTLSAANPESAATQFPQMTLPTSLTKERIRDGFGDPLSVSIWDLPGFIEHMNNSGFQALRHKVWLHSEIARPFFWVAMLFLAASFTMRHHRGGGMGIRVLAAVMSGFAMYFLRRFALIFGENGQIPPMIAAWTPVVASLMVAMALLLHQEDV